MRRSEERFQQLLLKEGRMEHIERAEASWCKFRRRHETVLLWERIMSWEVEEVLCVISSTSLSITALSFSCLSFWFFLFFSPRHFSLYCWVSSCFITLFSSSVFLLSHPVELMEDYRKQSRAGWQWMWGHGVRISGSHWEIKKFFFNVTPFDLDRQNVLAWSLNPSADIFWIKV